MNLDKIKEDIGTALVDYHERFDIEIDIIPKLFRVVKNRISKENTIKAIYEVGHNDKFKYFPVIANRYYDGKEINIIIDFEMLEDEDFYEAASFMIGKDFDRMKHNIIDVNERDEMASLIVGKIDILNDYSCYSTPQVVSISNWRLVVSYTIYEPILLIPPKRC